MPRVLRAGACARGPPGPPGPPGTSGGGGMTLVFWADQAQSTTMGVTSNIYDYRNIVVNNGITITNNGVPGSARLTLSQSGTYLIDVTGWMCGPGTGVVRVVGTRGGATIYDRTRGWAEACYVNRAQFLWDGWQAGDVIELFKNQNNSGAVTPSISISAQQDEVGFVAIYKVA